MSVASNGSQYLAVWADGGQAWNNNDPVPLTVPYASLQTLHPVCRANRCFAPWTNKVLRFEDTGTAFTVDLDTTNLNFETMKSPRFVFGQTLMALYSRAEFDPPYANAPTIVLRAIAEGKQRSVHH